MLLLLSWFIWRCVISPTSGRCRLRSGNLPSIDLLLSLKVAFELNFQTLHNFLDTLLWQGAVDQAIVLFAGCKFNRAVNFLAYLRNHCHRIPEYGYLQQQGITIGSGAVESTIMQSGGSKFLVFSGISIMSLKS